MAFTAKYNGHFIVLGDVAICRFHCRTSKKTKVSLYKLLLVQVVGRSLDHDFTLSLFRQPLPPFISYLYQTYIHK